MYLLVQTVYGTCDKLGTNIQRNDVELKVVNKPGADGAIYGILELVGIVEYTTE